MTTEVVKVKMSMTRAAVLRYVGQHPGYRCREIATKLGFTDRQVQNSVGKLRGRGLLVAADGPGKAAGIIATIDGHRLAADWLLDPLATHCENGGNGAICQLPPPLPTVATGQDWEQSRPYLIRLPGGYEVECDTAGQIRELIEALER